MDYTPRKKIHANCPAFSVNNCFNKYNCQYFYHNPCKDNFICSDPDCDLGHGLSLIKRMIVSGIYCTLYERPEYDTAEEDVCSRYFNCTYKNCTYHHDIPLEHRWTICNVINADTDEEAEELYKSTKTYKMVTKKQKENDIASKSSTKVASPPLSCMDPVRKNMSFADRLKCTPCEDNGINSWIEKTVSAKDDEIEQDLPENIDEDTDNLMEILNKTTIKTETTEIACQTDLTMYDIHKLEEVKKMYQKISQHIKSLK